MAEEPERVRGRNEAALAGGKERRALVRARGKHARTTHRTLYCPINSNLLPIAEWERRPKEGATEMEKQGDG